MPANGDMLRLARQRKGFRQTEAARRLAIEQPLLSRMENGLSEITESFLMRAELAYELPKSFYFLRDPVFGAPVSVHPMWRRKADVTAKELDMVVAELNLRVIHIRRFLEGVEFASTTNIPRLDIDDYEDPEEIAGIARAHWKVPSGPIRDLTALVEHAGIIVCLSEMGRTSISGVTFSAPGVPPLILLNVEQPADRMRYSLAHELGHLVMHRFPSSNMEREANEFAAAFLMPASDIRPYFNARRIDLALLAAMKPEWRVAMQALLMRASSLEFLTKNQSQYLWKQISARRLRLREPPELDFPKETPNIISAVVQLHLNSLGYSKRELAQLLHLFESDLLSMYEIEPSPSEKPRLRILK